MKTDSLLIEPGKIFEILFEYIPIGIAVFDRDFHLHRQNATFEQFFQQYGATIHPPLTVSHGMDELSAEVWIPFQPVIRRALAGETVQLEKIRTESSGSISYWENVFAPILDQGKVIGVLDVVTDVTGQVLANQQREEAFSKLQESENTLRSLVENAQRFAIYRVAVDPKEPYGGKLVLVSPSICDIVGIEDPYQFESWFKFLHPDDLPRVEEANRRAFEQGEPYNQTARFYHHGKEQWVWIHTISNPHFNEDGGITHFDGMVIDVTDQMNLREAERLRHAAERRRQAAEGLGEILKIINSNRPLQEILDFIALQSNQLLQSDSTMIRHLSIENDSVATVASYHLPPEFDQIRHQPFYRAKADEILMERQPVAMTDIPSVYLPRLANHVYTDESQRAGLEATVKYYKSLLKVPLFLKESIYGALTFHFEQTREFNEEDMRLAMTLADQAALAIENARLIDRVKETAVMDERNRLARELHDAVTQTLFSTTLIAEVLPKLWERSPAEGRKRLEELRQLNRGALAEMRTLLLELRPATLADTDLCDLLRHLTNAFIGRARVPVSLTIEGKCEIPLDVKVALYRIVQESLNNIAKHAEPEQVKVSLLSCEKGLHLVIEDDGLGFDINHPQADHLGLGIMRERAAQAGAEIEITSQIGQGTLVRVDWKPGPEPQIHS